MAPWPFEDADEGDKDDEDDDDDDDDDEEDDEDNEGENEDGHWHGLTPGVPTKLLLKNS